MASELYSLWHTHTSQQLHGSDFSSDDTLLGIDRDNPRENAPAAKKKETTSPAGLL